MAPWAKPTPKPTLTKPAQSVVIISIQTGFGFQWTHLPCTIFVHRGAAAGSGGDSSENIAPFGPRELGAMIHYSTTVHLPSFGYPDMTHLTQHHAPRPIDLEAGHAMKAPEWYHGVSFMSHGPQPAFPTHRTSKIITAAGLHRFVESLQATNVFSVDVRTTGADPRADRIRLLQIATEQATYALDVDRIGDLRPLLPLLQDPRRLKVMHFGKRTLAFLAQHLTFREPLGLLCPSLFDTYIAAQLLNESDDPQELGSLVRHYLGHELPATVTYCSKDSPLADIDFDHAGTTAHCLLHLRSPLRQRLIDADLAKVAKMEFDLVAVVADMEQTGIYLNMRDWERTWAPFHVERQQLAEELSRALGPHLPQSLFGTASFNPDSPQQTLEALQRLGLNIQHTGESLLKPFAESYPVVRTLLAYRAVAKAISSCGDVFPQYVHPKTHRVHARYHQIGARTGRMSCSDPNVQQVPRQRAIRSCFQAEPGRVLIVADYSQVELRVAAALAEDRRMMHAYRNNQDLHRLTASLITGTPFARVGAEERDAAKAVNFGLLYAMGANGLARYAKSEYDVDLSLEQAEAFRNRFFTAYTGLRRWHDHAKRQMREAQAGKAVLLRSIAGRRYVYQGEKSLAWFLNSPVQGSAADLMKNAMVRVHHALAQSTKARIIGVVHDELLVEAPHEDARAVSDIVRHEMEASAAEFFASVPFVAETTISASWGEA